jgi:cell division protein FtsZ
MNTNPSSDRSAESSRKPLSIKIFGVGSAGVKILEQIAGTALPGSSLVAVNTDPDSLLASTAAEKICLEPRQLRGLGTGGDPDRGRAAGEHHLSNLKTACAGANVIFIVTGLGGGTGTGVSPLLAHAAKEAGALVLAFATLPFDCEGNRRQQQAQQGLQELKATADGVICLPNQRLFKLIDDNTSVVDTFKLSNDLLAQGLCSVWRLMATKGLIDIHFEDLSALLRDRHGESCFATAEASGPMRAREAMDKLLSHPMLDGGKALAESDAVLVSLMGGSDLTMAEVNRVMESINGRCGKGQVIMGAAMDPELSERLVVTVIASRRSESLLAKAGLDESAHGEASSEEQKLDTQFHRTSTRRPQSRYIPPPPAMSADKMEQLLTRQSTGAAKPRKTSTKMRQGTLPLEIVSKGRFDKSEPTIHKGEDLDVPTYIRRGVALN